MPVTETIYIGRDAYMFLDREQRKQRGCKPISKESEDRLWKRIMKDKQGRCLVDDNSFGGGDGTYYGKWWSWSVSTIKNMLDEAGFTYEPGKPMEYINVII